MSADLNLFQNVLYSVEDFIYQNVVVPYNSAVTGTTHASQLAIMIDDPDDDSIIAKVPVIVMEMPTDSSGMPPATGMGDGMVWKSKQFYLRVYPALDTDATTGAQKPSIKATAVLESLFEYLSTALTLPIYDFTQTPKTVVNGAYIVESRRLHMGGKATMLALDKHRFDYVLEIKYPLTTLNG